MVPYLGFLLLQWNTVANSKLRRKGFIYLTLQFPKIKSGREFTKGGNLETGADCRDRAGGVLLTGLSLVACLQVPLLSYRTRNGTAHNALGLPLSVTEKMPCSWSSWRHFLSLSFLFSNNSSVCQVDINLGNTGGFLIQLYQIIHFWFFDTWFNTFSIYHPHEIQCGVNWGCCSCVLELGFALTKARTSDPTNLSGFEQKER